MDADTSTGLGALAAALAKAQGAIRGAAKDKTNPHFGSRYADLASVWDACRAALAANGLAVAQPTSVDEEGNVFVRTILLHTSGASIEGVYPVRPQQATPQGYGSAVTYARRYALAAMVGVAPDDDDDGEAASAGPVAPSPADLMARMGAATTLAELAAVEATVRQHWQTYPPATQKSLGKHRDAAKARLTKAAVSENQDAEPPPDVPLPDMRGGK